MKICLVILLLFSTTSIFCQKSTITKIIGAELTEADTLTEPEITQESLSNVTSYLYRYYPPLASKTGTSGKIILTLICSKEGNPSDIKIKFEKPADMGFGEVAVDAAKFLKYSPAKLNGVPVEVEINQRITFNTTRYNTNNKEFFDFALTYRLREL